MGENNETKVKNNLWRLLSRGVRTEHVSALASRLRKMFMQLAAFVRHARSTDAYDDTRPLTKGEKSLINPIYKGPQITVPWTGPVFEFPTSRKLTNAELKAQVNLLELRFWKQGEIMARHRSQTCVLQRVRSARIPFFNEKKVAEMADLVEKIKLRQYIKESGLGKSAFD
ncbi:hypothetical protein DPMN_034449 [Dreissena polymorpha]|uniref:Uncharacterized protein n=1 Tax=Dreissena polymorpha TaxID=45954 RepID=A0A9D4M8P2_DREPO|nr:hypothetical protein DPMN_034449 [Dreissena polymorpha]